MRKNIEIKKDGVVISAIAIFAVLAIIFFAISNIDTSNEENNAIKELYGSNIDYTVLFLYGAILIVFFMVYKKTNTKSKYRIKSQRGRKNGK